LLSDLRLVGILYAGAGGKSIAIMRDGTETNLKEMDQAKRLHLRLAYDPYKKDLYIITKIDGKVRRVAKAY